MSDAPIPPGTSLADLDQAYVKTEIVDEVGYIRLNRPPANSHDLQMVLEFDQAVLATRFDDGVKVVVVGSELDRFFSAGADIKELDAQPAYRTGLLSQTTKEIVMRIRAIPKVFIASIGGHCMGGGLEFAMACDLRFAADGPEKFGMPEIQLGMIPGEGGTQLLGRTVGMSRALEVMLDGGAFDVHRAAELGIVDRVFPPDRLAEETHAYARKIATGPTRAAGFLKIALTEGLEMPLHAAFAFERQLQNELLASPDAHEGVRAYLEKRAPKFSGGWVA